MDLVSHLSQQLKTYLTTVDKDLVVAYSGGVDSHVLLHALASLRQHYPFRLSAIHIHHGLSINSELWLQHCATICEDLAIPLHSAKLGLEKQARQSLEAQAREARYAKLQVLASDKSLVLLGQHQDDQLETMLLQLKRGAGPKGLSAMVRQWQVTDEKEDEISKTVGYMRPLLEITQGQILDYAKQHNLHWQEDESNQNTDFERNFLRQKVLPTLTKRWPELAKSASRSAALCAEQQSLLDEVSKQKLDLILSANQSLSITKLSELSDSWQRQVLRFWLHQQHIPSPSQAVLKQLKGELFAASEDANPIIQWQKWQFRRFDQQLYIVPLSAELTALNIDWQGELSIELPQALGRVSFSHKVCDMGRQASTTCKLDSMAGPIKLRFGGYSEKFKPLGERHSKPLKQWFKLWGIPPWKRDKIAILLQNEQVKALIIDKRLLLSEEQIDSPAGNNVKALSQTKDTTLSALLMITVGAQ